MKVLPFAVASACVALFGAPACSSATSEPHHRATLTFSLQYDGSVIGCGDTLEGVGLSESTVELRDARMFVHDVQVILDDATTAALELDDSEWQREGVALLDFADDTGLCATGSPATNHELVGSYTGDGEIVGVSFRIGLPPELNHIDAARAPAPLNAPGMAWSWTGGFKYARIDVQSTENETWHLHLGATGCEGSPADGISCTHSNLATIEVDGLGTPPTVVLDLGALYANSDLDAIVDHETDLVSGCMAFGGDPECASVFETLGLTFEGDEPLEQKVFRGQ